MKADYRTNTVDAAAMFERRHNQSQDDIDYDISPEEKDESDYDELDNTLEP